MYGPIGIPGRTMAQPRPSTMLLGQFSWSVLILMQEILGISKARATQKSLEHKQLSLWSIGMPILTSISRCFSKWFWTDLWTLGSGSFVNEIIVVVLQRYSDRCWLLVGQVAEGSACCRATATGQINKRHEVAPCRLVHGLCLKIRALRFHSFLSRNSILVVFQNLQTLRRLPYAMTCVLWHYLCLMTLTRLTRYRHIRQNPSTAGESQKSISISHQVRKQHLSFS